MQSALVGGVIETLRNEELLYNELLKTHFLLVLFPLKVFSPKNYKSCFPFLKLHRAEMEAKKLLRFYVETLKKLKGALNVINIFKYESKTRKKTSQVFF